MKCLNSLYRVACLQCSFNDKELGKYIQYKKRNIIQLSKKFAAIMVGQQPDGLWVISYLPDDSSDRLEEFECGLCNFTQSSSFREVPASSDYVWIGHVFCGTSVASTAQQRNTELTLTTDPLLDTPR